MRTASANNSLGNRRTIFYAMSILLVLLVTPHAHAENATDLATAEALFDQGIKLMNEGHYNEACPKLAESLRLDTGIGTMLWLADCYGKMGRFASAWAQFREAAWMAEKQGDDRLPLARKKVDEFADKYSTLTIVVDKTSYVDDLKVLRDGQLVTKEQWGVPVPIDAGSHAIVISAPSKETFSSSFKIELEKSTKTLHIPALKPVQQIASAPAFKALASVEPTPKASHGTAQRILGVITGSLGLVSLGVGSIFGLHAKSALADSNAHCTNNVCDPTGGRLREDARSAATTSTIFFASGLGALAGGTVLYFTAPKGPKLEVRSTVGHGDAGIEIFGTF